MEGVSSTRLGDIYVRREADIVKVRDRVRRLAREMGFDSTTQIKITTAVSELTRNIYDYAKAGAITLGRRARASSGRSPGTARITDRDRESQLPRSCAAANARLPSWASARGTPARKFDIAEASGEAHWSPSPGAPHVAVKTIERIADLSRTSRGDR